MQLLLTVDLAEGRCISSGSGERVGSGEGKVLNIWSDLAVLCRCVRLCAHGAANVAGPEELGWSDEERSCLLEQVHVGLCRRAVLTPWGQADIMRTGDVCQRPCFP